MDCDMTSSKNEVTSQHLECLYYSCLPYFTSLKRKVYVWITMLSVCLLFQVLKRQNNFWEIWYKFYTTRSTGKCIITLQKYRDTFSVRLNFTFIVTGNNNIKFLKTLHVLWLRLIVSHFLYKGLTKEFI
jgi:hypothetical protein